MRNFIHTQKITLALGAAVTFLALAAGTADAASPKVESWDLYYDDGSYFGTLDGTRTEAKAWCGVQFPDTLGGVLAPVTSIFRAGRTKGDICR